MLDKLTEFSTGLESLDEAIQGFLPGDSVVWQIDAAVQYQAFLHPFCRQALKNGKNVIYFRFAEHDQLLADDSGAEIHHPTPEQGFEPFIMEVADIIAENGDQAFYVFDCISELVADWDSDRMLGNFFILICSLIKRCKALGYFATMRDRHSYHVTDGIDSTAQVIIDVYSHKNLLYVKPAKVHQRSSKTMYLLHEWREDDKFAPVSNSAHISDILADVPQPWVDFTIHRLGTWTRTFIDAQTLYIESQERTVPEEKMKECLRRLLRMAFTRDERFLKHAEKYLTLPDILEIRKRMIGTGLIGGKAVGMILARAILRHSDKRWEGLLETHDSYFIGSDVFYTYLIQNNCWWMHKKADTDALIAETRKSQQRILNGDFPKYIREQFVDMLEYFGQAPIIVRSSSLLEDNYGNAFSGKYDSVFCVNRGNPEQRLAAFMRAVREVYASTLSKKALLYRIHKGLLQHEEQMGLLVQRVSGSNHGSLYFPQIAGVGYSFNPYVWNQEIDRNAGMVRLVYGLGTRAVDRHDDDYTRVIALNAPQRRPESSSEDVRRYAQLHVDVLDLEANRPTAVDFEDIVNSIPELPINLFASRDHELERRAREHNMKGVFSRVLTFEDLLSKTTFVEDMQSLLQTIQNAYDWPVDVEFAANFLDENTYRINLLQCRPFQVKAPKARIPQFSTDGNKVIMQTGGPIIGNSIAAKLDQIIYVVPEAYANLSVSERYSVARLIGNILHHEDRETGMITMLIGPGRWGTTTPHLGVPVSFAEINNANVLCEIAGLRDGLVADMSLGTHFFNDLVEMDMVYIGFHPNTDNDIFDKDLLSAAPNQLPDLLPDSDNWAQVVRVIDRAASSQPLYLHINSIKQKAVLYTTDQ